MSIPEYYYCFMCGKKGYRGLRPMFFELAKKIEPGSSVKIVLVTELKRKAWIIKSKPKQVNNPEFNNLRVILQTAGIYTEVEII